MLSPVWLPLAAGRLWLKEGCSAVREGSRVPEHSPEIHTDQPADPSHQHPALQVNGHKCISGEASNKEGFAFTLLRREWSIRQNVGTPEEILEETDLWGTPLTTGCQLDVAALAQCSEPSSPASFPPTLPPSYPPHTSPALSLSGQSLLWCEEAHSSPAMI